MYDRFLLSFTLPVIYHWNGTQMGQCLARCGLFRKLHNYSWVFIGSCKFTTNILYQVEVKPDLKKKSRFLVYVLVSFFSRDRMVG